MKRHLKWFILAGCSIFLVILWFIVHNNPNTQISEKEIEPEIIEPQHPVAPSKTPPINFPDEEPIYEIPTHEHQVSAGDTLYQIAQHYGLSLDELQRWNCLQDIDLIQDGQKLLLVEPKQDICVANTPSPPSLPPQQDTPISSNGKTVYLTFDDGPSRNTAAILDILKAEQIPATFFVLGHSITHKPQSHHLINRILDEGHYIGLHSMTHDKEILYRSPNAAANFLNEMQSLQQLIREISGFETWLYRPPFGTYNNFTAAHIETMRQSSFNGWDWNVDSNDWSATSVEQVLENVQAGLHLRRESSELILLFHEHDITIEALPVIINYLRDNGYQFGIYDPDNHFTMNLIREPGI